VLNSPSNYIWILLLPACWWKNISPPPGNPDDPADKVTILHESRIKLLMWYYYGQEYYKLFYSDPSFLCIRIFIAQQKSGGSIPAGYRISQDEIKLYHMINDFRRKYDLPPIPLSISLCYVASSHVRDLFFNHPDQEPCNFHSWSDKGPWKAFCYPRDENKKNSVWDKPKEFTPYKGKGYEIVYWENNQADIDSVINLWKSVGYFNNFLLNTGKWQNQKWEALGVGIFEIMHAPGSGST